MSRYFGEDFDQMDSFDLNAEYSHADEDTFVPCTQEEFEDIPIREPSIETALPTTRRLQGCTLTPGPTSPFGALSFATAAAIPPRLRTFKRRTTCPKPGTSSMHSASTHVSLDQDSQPEDWDSIHDINSDVPSLQTFSTPTPSIERGLNWQDHETFLLLEGKKRLDEDM